MCHEDSLQRSTCTYMKVFAQEYRSNKNEVSLNMYFAWAVVGVRSFGITARIMAKLLPFLLFNTKINQLVPSATSRIFREFLGNVV